MKLKRSIFFIVFFLITIATYSQIDSLENRNIYSWNLNSYDLSLDLVELDTSLASFQNFNPLLKKTISANYLGNMGTAAQSKIYYDRKLFETGFIFSKPYGVYFQLPIDQLYYNTKSPFTLLNYSAGGPKEESEQVLSVLYTRNINKDFNFGFDYDMISSDGRYQNQEVRQNHVTVYSSYQKKGYRLHTNFGFNRIKAQENGGIDSLQYVGDNDYKNRRNIPVRLQDARTQVFNTHFYLAQEYRFGKTIEEFEIVKKKESLSHSLKIDNSKKILETNSINLNEVSIIGDSVSNKNELYIIQDSIPPDSISNKDELYIIQDSIPPDSISNKDELYIIQDSIPPDSISKKDELFIIQDSIELDSISLENIKLNDTIPQNLDLDTIRVFKISGFSISHELIYNSDVRKFFDENLTDSFYNARDIYIDSLKTNDIVEQKQFGNKVSLNYKFQNKFSTRLSFYNEQMKYNNNIRPDSSIYNLPLGDTIIKSNIGRNISNSSLSFYFKTLFFNHVLFSGYGEYYISGYKKEDSKLKAKVAYILFKTTELSLEGNYSDTRPDYFYENFTSNNFKWENDFLRKIEEWDAGFAIRNSKNKLTIKIQYGQNSNYLYLDTTAYVNQYRGQINLLTAELSKKLKLGPINSVTRFVYQKSTKDSILSLPKYNLYQSLYFERLSTFPSTGGQLLWQLGVDYRFTSSYMADGYMPTTGLFYRQFNHKQVNYHCFDVYINMTIKRARFYLKYNYLNSVINKNYYFTGPFYPSPEPILKFGLAWTFHD